MRATFRGALAALAAVALAGCSATGAAEPTGAPSHSPEMQDLVEVMTSDTRTELVAAADKFDGDQCAVHLERNDATPEWGACVDTRNDLAGLAGKLEILLSGEQPVPAEADALVAETGEALQGVKATAAGADPKQVTLSLEILRGTLKQWSALGG